MKKLTPKDASRILKDINTFFFDCDGVLWNGVGLLPKAKELIVKLANMNKQVFFITNNNTKSRQDFLKKFINHGFNVESRTTLPLSLQLQNKLFQVVFKVYDGKKQILSTSYLAAAYVKNILKLDENKKVYMVGMEGLKQEFDLMGIKSIGCGPYTAPTGGDSNIYNRMLVEKDPDVGAVVVGFDDHFCLFKISEAMQYLLDPDMPFIATNTDNRFPVGAVVVGYDDCLCLFKISEAMQYLLDPDMPFIATNTDSRCPVKVGYNAPGTGVVVQAVATAAERQPIVLGKPNKMFLEVAQTTCDIDPTRTLMIGDRLNTDIQFGYNCGFHTMCVLTGVTTETKLMETETSRTPDLIPDYFSDDLIVLCEAGK